MKLTAKEQSSLGVRIQSQSNLASALHPDSLQAFLHLYGESDEESGDGEFNIYDDMSNSIILNGVIVDDETVDSICQFWGSPVGFVSPGMVRAAVKEADDGYALEINSPGGDVYAGVEMVSVFRKNPPESSIVTGIAASMAAMIALVPDERYAGNELATMMFHGPWGCFCGNATEMESISADLRKIEGSFKSFIDNRLPKNGAKQVNGAIDGGTDMLLSVDECVGLGILEGVVTHSNDQSKGPDDDDSGVLSGKAMPRWQQLAMRAAQLKFQSTQENSDAITN